MQRRVFLQKATMAAGSAGFQSWRPRLTAVAETQAVKQVLLITKCHLDVGFTATQQKVKQRYFQEHFPAAMDRAAQLRLSGGDRYIWTTGSWLLYEYLEQASPAVRKKVEQAIEAQDLSWHALPFTWQTEMLDRSMIEGGLGISAALDRRFGRKTVGAKMTDVPGHTRGLITPLQAAGVQLLDIGVNPASTAPDVPEVFLWKSAAGNSLPVIYHRHDYGSVVTIPGTDAAVAVAVRGDNSGPHTPAEIAMLYAGLRQQFPAASVKAATLNDAALVVDRVRDHLPVVTGEIGDTWIYGVASDPDKVSSFRAAARLRLQWIAQKRFSVGDATDVTLLRNLLLGVEHTWGTDTKTYLDTDHYLAKDLATVLDQPGYRTMEVSWQEKRDDIRDAFNGLPAAYQDQAKAALHRPIKAALSPDGMHPLPTGQSFTTKHFIIAADAVTGAITRLQRRSTGQEFASAAHPMALLTYQTLSATAYAAFLERYVKSKESWAPRDFGKPGIEHFGAVDTEWHPRVVSSWTSTSSTGDRMLLHLQFDSVQAEPIAAWPKQAFLEIRCPTLSPELELGLVLLDKQANRMPEALWLTFQPQMSPAPQERVRLMFEKAGELVEVNEAVQGGGRAMHAVSGSTRYQTANARLELTSTDAVLVAVGERSPLNFSLQRPHVENGIHYGLFNNAWGTNYPQWCGGSWSYDFSLRF